MKTKSGNTSSLSIIAFIALLIFAIVQSKGKKTAIADLESYKTVTMQLCDSTKIANVRLEAENDSLYTLINGKPRVKIRDRFKDFQLWKNHRIESDSTNKN